MLKYNTKIYHKYGKGYFGKVTLPKVTVRSSSHEQSVNSNMHELTSLSTTTFKLASSTMFKPINNHVQAGQFNHVQAYQQPCSSWPVQPCSSLSTTMFKVASSTMFKPVNRQKQAVRFYVCKCMQYSKLSIFEVKGIGD